MPQAPQAQPPQPNPLLEKLFQPVQFARNDQGMLTKGSLILFRYAFWKNDPMPLVIVTDFINGQRVRGVNLHYLTYSYIRNLLQQGCGNSGFSYGNIRNNTYITGAFRTYKWGGISQVKKFDCQFILKMMTMARTFDPAQVRAIRQSVEQQLQQELLPQAQNITNQEING